MLKNFVVVVIKEAVETLSDAVVEARTLSLQQPPSVGLEPLS